MKRRILSALSILSITMSMGLHSAAFANIKHQEESSNSLATVSQTVSFQGLTFRLLDTFSDPDTALVTYTTNYSTELHAIQEKYSLPELSVDTATQYKQALINADDDSLHSNQELIRFLDLYENPSENKAIINQLHTFSDQVVAGHLSRDEAIALARNWVPTKPENGNEQTVTTDRSSIGFNIFHARHYANLYANHINEKYGEEKAWFLESVDCTNFASQILYAGDVAMDEYNDVAKGWWWKAKGKRSISWINANVFKNYMGSGYSTKNWKDFVANVEDGDFIAVDYNDDGTVDHIGWIYTIDTGRLKIAQHTRNYLDWNGNWPSYDGEGRYYRVRR